MQIILSGRVGRNLSILTDRDHLTLLLQELTAHMGMECKGKPHMESFDSVDGRKDLSGLSAVQFIYTSSITVHTYPHHQHIDLDIFSCRRIPQASIDWLVDLLDLEPTYHLTLHDRGTYLKGGGEEGREKREGFIA